jgi:hypothetical protein
MEHSNTRETVSCLASKHILPVTETKGLLWFARELAIEQYPKPHGSASRPYAILSQDPF